MEISLLSERITIEKNETRIDAIGNHTNEWTKYFCCAARAATSTRQQKEQEKAGVTVGENGLVFTVRYCSELADLDSTHYRVLFRGDVYNIVSVNRMDYDRKSIQISCEQERRNV